MQRFSIAVICLAALLSSCSPSSSGPTESDVEKAFGIQVHDNQCVEAAGRPGYMCTFITDGPENWTITRRLIKTGSGWQGVDGN